jgi:ElaB/YqjD/DUF883 family membrane-anchored ribosome-binding protein
MGEDPEAIRREIEATRAEMGETVEAIGDKADVKTRAKESVAQKKDALKSKVTGVSTRARDRTPGTEDAKQGARRAAGLAQENPLGLALGAVAAGFVAGVLLPSTRWEHEKIGPVADHVKEKATETGEEAFKRGRQVAQDAAETAKESGQKHGEELRSSAQQKAEETRSQA